MAKTQHRLALAGVMATVVLGIMSAAPAIGQANQPPTAVVTASPTTGQIGTIIVFDGTDSVDFDGTIVSYSWDFGDGTPTVSGNVDEVGLLYHTFESDGTYTVTLDVTDDQETASDPSDPTATVIITIGTGTTTTQPPATGGEGLFNTACSACHTQANLSGRGLSSSQLVTVMTSGMMAAQSGSLSTSQIQEVADYIVLADTGGEPLPPTTTTIPPEGASAGALYSSQCAACHGGAGQGTPAGPSLQASVWTESATILAVTNGVGSMPGFSESLSSGQINAVSVYSVRLQTDDPADPIEGDGAEGSAESVGAPKLYEANCAACHGGAGEGGVAVSLQGSVFTFDATADAIANGVGSMPGFSSGLSENEIKDLAVYTVAFQGGTSASGEPTPSGALPTGEGADIYAASCAACHGAIGEGASAMPINVPFDNDQLVEIIRVGIGDMPGFATALNEEQVVALAEYTHALALLSVPPTPAPPSIDEYIVAIQPSKYVEFDTARSSVPLDSRTQIVFALGTMALLGLIVLWEVRRALKISRASAVGGPTGSSGPG